MAICGLTHRVDLNLGRVLVLEDLVEVDEDVGGFVKRALGLEAQLLRDGKSLILAETLLKVDRCGDDGRGVLGSNLLNVHATLRRRDEDGTADTTIIENRDVVLVCGIAAFCKHNL